MKDRHVTLIVIGAALSSAVATAASASAFPEFDVKAICHRDAQCAAYQFLLRGWVARDWNKLSEAEKSRCVEETANDYNAVWACVHSFLQQKD
jgi:hypothetical protein